MKVCKLSDIAEVQTGPFGSQLHNEDYVEEGTPIVTVEHLGNRRFTIQNLPFVSNEDKERLSKYSLQEGDIVFSRVGSVDRCSYVTSDENGWLFSGRCLRVRCHHDCDALYLYYYFCSESVKEYVRSKAVGATMPSLNTDLMSKVPIILPQIEVQKKIAKTLSLLDSKIELNRQINDNLEAMAKQLYDYWFVQFDFPNEEGKPYKSSGGEMVWNNELHMYIPDKWNTCNLSEYIGKNNTGDWGFEEPAKDRKTKVGCIRGADIIKLNNLPLRYIKDSNTVKLLSEWDIVIEVSGGSPVQATGRSAFITPGVIKRNGGNLTCSNFCHAFTMKDYKASAFFYFMWRMFYENNNMFNFEGKTSGIKNFMTDTFLANKWIEVPPKLIDMFFERIKTFYEQIDNNIEESNMLTKQRDELLPLLMNGQATINYHLSDD